MAIEDIYDSRLGPLYPESTDVYADEIPSVETHGMADELASKPGAVADYLTNLLKNNQDNLRQIEVSRRAIAYGASIMREIVDSHPELLALLSDEKRAEIEDWAARIQTKVPEP